MSSVKTVVMVAAAVLLCGAIDGRAQGLTSGQTEVFGLVGRVSDGGGSTFGGGVQFAVNPRLLVGGEFSYLTGGEDFDAFGVDVDSHAIAIDANARYLFPTGNGKFVPYVLGGFGVLRFSASVSAAGTSIEASDSTFGINLGGGVRFDVGENWGVQPELKLFIADGSNVRISGALYYRF